MLVKNPWKIVEETIVARDIEDARIICNSPEQAQIILDLLNMEEVQIELPFRN